MFSIEKFLTRQTELDTEMSKIWGNPYLDGITDYEKYIKAPIKILWILKEPNGMGGGNHRIFHKDVRDYSLWQMTFGNIMRVGYGIFEGCNNYNEIPEIDKSECLIGDYPILDEIAIINVNKSGGNSSTPQGKLDIEYERTGVKEFLHKQIEFINPEIIINSHGVYRFFLDQIGDNNIKVINGEKYAMVKNRLIIWTSHPNRAPKESYCNNILRIANEKN
jgi:hypothetical protein